MKRKRKVFYPPSRSAKGSAPTVGAVPFVPTTVVAINLRAGIGRKDIVVGSRVTILGTGLYAGEMAVVERLIGAVRQFACGATQNDDITVLVLRYGR